VNSPKVRHHCHVTGKYVGAWCRRCNYLEGKKKLQLVVFFHNLRGNDAHMILRYGLMEIAKLHGKDGNVRQFIIGKSAEKLSSFQFGNFIFRDSLLHLGCSLERAVDNLIKSNYDFPICEKVGLHPLLRRKGIYPYKWVDSVKKFKYTVLPSIEFFHNDLTQELCSPEDYQHAQNVWKTLKCKTFGDYHHHYLMADVVLLADVFEEYRTKGLSNWQLDPAQFVTAPSYTYKAFLKYIDRPIQVMWDLQMYEFFRDAMRGGYCSVGETVFANVYKKEGECIVGFDMNSLYPTAMLHPMPLCDFEWISGEEGERILRDKSYNWVESETGYWLEVDILCPKNIHDRVAAYPLFPERIDGKLKATLSPKVRYKAHIANLRLGMELGYKIIKVHRGIKFRQERFMAPYISKLAEERRKNKSNPSLAEFYKLMMNSLFGKTCENPENYRKFKLSAGTEMCIRILNSLKTIKDYHLIDPEKDVVLLELMKCEVHYNKPLAIGATILDVSKWYMQTFYYKVLKPYYEDRMKFLYTDTDSIVGWFKTKDIKEDLKDPRLSPHFETPNTEKVPGFMKIEKIGIVMFYALCLKHYFFVIDKNGKLVCNEAFKGIPGYARNKPNQEELEKILRSEKPSIQDRKKYTMQTIRPRKHEVFVMQMEREPTDEDDKRYYVPNSYETLSWGHYKIQ
jgi:hypothetical protein